MAEQQTSEQSYGKDFISKLRESKSTEPVDKAIYRTTGISIPGSNQGNGRDLIRKIRETKSDDMWKRKDAELDYQSLMNNLDQIYLGNRKIEHQVRMELLGIDSSPVKKAGYWVVQGYKRLSGKPQERAQDIIGNQIERVDTAAQGILVASKVIDSKGEKLESYYDRLTGNLTDGASYRKRLLKGIGEDERLITETKKALQEAESFEEKVSYNAAMRKIRRGMQEKQLKIKLADRSIVNLTQEIPFIDSFSEFCQAYSFSLREAFQEVQNIKSHLSNVTGLYLELMRTRHINGSLDKEVDKLLGYTDNMNNAIVGARDLIMDVNKNETFNQEYTKRYSTLEGMLEDVFSSNSKTFEELESRIGPLVDSDTSERRLED